MKKYNVIEKKTGNLLLTFITYNQKVEKSMLFQFKKLRRQVDIVEVKM